jgi:catechol 2,3-dioxygenase-like lactoylglutathione lyase family enzyme
LGLSITSLTIDSRDPDALAEFWARVLNYEVIYRSPEGEDEREVVIAPPGETGQHVLFAQNPDAKVAKNRLHLDLRPGDQAAEVERVLALGATHVDIGQGDVTWVVLADPEGNEFCILRALRPDEEGP